MHVGEFGVFDDLTERAHALSQDGDVAEAIARCHAIEALCEAAGDEQTLRYALYIRGSSAVELGHASEAAACAHGLLAMVRDDPRPYWHVKALALEATARSVQGDHATAVDLLARATVMLGDLDGRDYNQVSASGAIAVAMRRLELFEASDEQHLRMVPLLTPDDGITIVADSLNTVAEWGLALRRRRRARRGVRAVRDLRVPGGVDAAPGRGRPDGRRSGSSRSPGRSSPGR